MIGQGRDDEFHGVDACGGGLNGHHAIGFDADVSGRDLEDLQPRADDLVGLGMRSLGHGGRPEGSFFNVVVVVSFVWMERVDVLSGFYTLLLVGGVDGTILGSTDTRADVSHWPPTNLRIEAILDHCEWREGANAQGSFFFFVSSSSSSDSKNIPRFLGLFGKQGIGRLDNGLDVLVGQGFLGAFVEFFLDHLLRFAFDPAGHPCF